MVALFRSEGTDAVMDQLRSWCTSSVSEALRKQAERAGKYLHNASVFCFEREPDCLVVELDSVVHRNVVCRALSTSVVRKNTWSSSRIVARLIRE